MPVYEFCLVEVCQNVKKGLIRKTTYHWEAQKITAAGKETLFKSGEYSLTYNGDPVSMREERKKEKDTREDVIRFLTSQGWQPAGVDEKGNVVTFQREISSSEAVPIAQGSIKDRLATLKDVYEAGLVSDEEYAQKRSEILKEM
jgi:hypothetical protein